MRGVAGRRRIGDEMQSDSIEMLGLIAGFIGAFAFAPQAFKILRDGDASGVSGLTYAMVMTGAVLWGVYGVFRGAPSVLILKLRKPRVGM